MANELTVQWRTGVTVDAYFESGGSMGRNDTLLLETENASNWALYGFAMADTHSTGLYRLAFPAIPAATYNVFFRERQGTNPAVGDTSIGSQDKKWSGVAFQPSILAPVSLLTLTMQWRTGHTVDAYFEDLQGRMMRSDTLAAETEVAANWSLYGFVMADTHGTGLYRLAFPSFPVNTYSVFFRERAGGSPAVGDLSIGSRDPVMWNATTPGAVALTWRQKRQMKDLCDVFLPTFNANSGGGKPANTGWTVYTRSQRYEHQSLPNQGDPSPVGRLNRPNLFTRDNGIFPEGACPPEGAVIRNWTPANNQGQLPDTYRQVYRVLAIGQPFSDAGFRHPHETITGLRIMPHPPVNLPS